MFCDQRQCNVGTSTDRLAALKLLVPLTFGFLYHIYHCSRIAYAETRLETALVQREKFYSLVVVAFYPKAMDDVSNRPALHGLALTMPNSASS